MRNKSTLIIAEAGVNHNGSLDLAIELINEAASAGADVVKFQTYIAEKLVSHMAEKANYQKKNMGEERQSQLEMLKKYQFDLAEHQILFNHCKNKAIQFLSSPFDHQSVDLLTQDLQLDLIKIPSGEITNGPLLLHIAQQGPRIILSSGMSTLADIERALSVIAFGYLEPNGIPTKSDLLAAFASSQGQKLLKERVSLLHCTSQYPTPYEDVHLQAMDTMRYAFGLMVGLSDHTEGIAIPIAAVARGARIIEKHFTLDKTLPGPDHKASLSPEELKTMVTSIRQVELAIGHSIKSAAASEVENMLVARKTLVAAQPIQQGEYWNTQNLTCKRTGKVGKDPMHFWDMLGKSAKRNYQVDEVVDD